MQPIPLSQCEIDISQYKKGKRIDKGGFGIIYSVRNKKDGQTYAAKVIDCGDDEQQCKKIIDREVSIMMSVKHNTIIKFMGYSTIDFQEEHNVTIIMEFAQNGSLTELLQKIQRKIIPDSYTNTTRQIILIGISRGLKYLHDRNIMHRDVKSGNILLDSQYHPLITDFGMSKFFNVGHSFSQSQHAGTLAYMAPEIIDGCPYDRKADIYSFGILMYEVVTDSIPYPELHKENINDREFKNNVVDKNYRPKFHHPLKKSIQNLIEKCWSKDPNERPSFKELFNSLINKDFFLENVDGEVISNYVNEIDQITDPFEELLNRTEMSEKEIQQLTTERDILKNNNEMMEKQISGLIVENQMLASQLKERKQNASDQENETANRIDSGTTIKLDCHESDNIIRNANFDQKNDIQETSVTIQVEIEETAIKSNKEKDESNCLSSHELNQTKPETITLEEQNKLIEESFKEENFGSSSQSEESKSILHESILKVKDDSVDIQKSQKLNVNTHFLKESELKTLNEKSDESNKELINSDKEKDNKDLIQKVFIGDRKVDLSEKPFQKLNDSQENEVLIENPNSNLMEEEVKEKEVIIDNQENNLVEEEEQINKVPIEDSNNHLVEEENENEVSIEDLNNHLVEEDKENEVLTENQDNYLVEEEEQINEVSIEDSKFTFGKEEKSSEIPIEDLNTNSVKEEEQENEISIDNSNTNFFLKKKRMKMER